MLATVIATEGATALPRRVVIAIGEDILDRCTTESYFQR